MSVLCVGSKRPPRLDYVGGFYYTGLGYAPIPLQHVRGIQRCKKLGRSYVRRAARDNGGTCNASS